MRYDSIRSKIVTYPSTNTIRQDFDNVGDLKRCPCDVEGSVVQEDQSEDCSAHGRRSSSYGIDLFLKCGFKRCPNDEANQH
jgi:hypothetical protein